MLQKETIGLKCSSENNIEINGTASKRSCSFFILYLHFRNINF